MASMPPIENPQPTSPGQPDIPPAEISPPGHDIDVPAPGAPAEDPAPGQPSF